jgi:hypothetical protein
VDSFCFNGWRFRMGKLWANSLVITGLFLCVGAVRAERVGYSFQGNLQVLGTGNVSLFNISVPKTSPVTGTFSYDTATQVIGAGATQTYPQLISGGFTLNINNGAIKLVASDYTITVADDSGSPASDSFSVDYNYDSAALPPIAPEKLLVNGAQWTGSRAFIKYFLSWDPSTFMDSALTAGRPLTPSPGVTAFVGSNGTPRFFSVTSTSAIEPPSGDFNDDGQVNSFDYTEWRKSFADGNNDGVVDAADYVIWRKASAPGIGVVLIPEPSGLVMTFSGLIFFAWRAVPWIRDERRR